MRTIYHKTVRNPPIEKVCAVPTGVTRVQALGKIPGVRSWLEPHVMFDKHGPERPSKRKKSFAKAHQDFGG
ncbi:hypothetical protein B7494_g991 [Chlorociboria aeruginascens]|nr:hypothetical protein B7494_g991 [Chlorociboria aeruginascens]